MKKHINKKIHDFIDKNIKTKLCIYLLFYKKGPFVKFEQL